VGFFIREKFAMFPGNRNPQILRVTALSALFILVNAVLLFAADTSTLTWTKLKPMKRLPARALFASAYDPISKKVVVFGGNNSQATLNDTYTFDGQAWTKVKTKVAPPARAAAMMAYDRRIRKLVLFGGASGFLRLNDTWLWDGASSTWTQANPKTVPPAASGPILFTDPANGHVDMFGGNRGQFYSRDTFQWTGKDWKLLKLDEKKSPYPRMASVVASDPIRKNVVLFGGISDNWVVQNTWTWNGTKWTEQKPTTQPPPLYYTTGGFDPLLKEIIVFGGGSVAQDKSTTWAWDGSTWTRLSPSNRPAAREGLGTVWDPIGRQFLVFDGYVFNTSNYFGDTWVLSGK
jgi:hypothetical protein